MLNLTSAPLDLELPELAGGGVLLGTHLDRDGTALERRISLRPDEGLVVDLT